MPVNIHGKQYITVVERVQEAHKDQEGMLSITTELVSTEKDRYIVKATVIIPKGVYTGYAEQTRGEPGIAGKSPIEVAETSAVGRALGFAGFGAIESIASAEEVIAKSSLPDKPKQVPDSKRKYQPISQSALDASAEKIKEGFKL